MGVKVHLTHSINFFAGLPVLNITTRKEFSEYGEERATYTTESWVLLNPCRGVYIVST